MGVGGAGGGCFSLYGDEGDCGRYAGASRGKGGSMKKWLHRIIVGLVLLSWSTTAQAAIARVNSAFLGNLGSVTTGTASYTVGSGATRMLIVVFFGDAGATDGEITSVTYAGNAMTEVLSVMG